MPDDEGSDSERFLRALAAMPAVTPPDARDPERLGRFRVVERIGAGGMGVVYRARDESLDREVALKVLPAHFEDDAERRRRFFREARAAASIDHVNVARVLEVGEEEGRAFVAMELVRGETLRARLVRGPLGALESIRVAREIVLALEAAHARGVVHRDLKPENVMITPDGAIKVLDFGLAKVERAPRAEGEASTLLTEEGRIMGTPGYMSPEQTLGARVDARSDLFSLGVVLYECLAGSRPFTGDSAMAILVATTRDEPPPLARDVPRAAAAVVKRCLAKRPEDRYANARALFDALDASDAVGRLSRSRWPLIAIATLLTVACATLAARVSTRSRARGDVAPVVVASAPTPVHAVPLTDHPSPKSSSPDALKLYADGLDRTRHGRGRGCDAFREATVLDPDFAAAHLRLALCNDGDVAISREPFRRALALRASLDERDRALLDAFEPIVMRQPSDPAMTQERLRALLERYPGDVEIAFRYATSLGASRRVTDPEVLAALSRVVDLDPEYVDAIGTYAQVMAYDGRFDDALRALAPCIAMSVGSAQCRVERIRMKSVLADCAAVEDDARNAIATAPGFALVYSALASVLAARTGTAAAREVMHQAESLAQADVDADERRFAMLAGDFVAAKKRIEAAIARADASPRELDHGSLARDLVDVCTESGDVACAKRAADDYLGRRDGWEPDPRPDDSFVFEATPVALAALRRTGAMSEAAFDAARTQRLEWWRRRVRSAEPGFLWVAFFAVPADTRADAERALAELPRFERIPPFTIEGSLDPDVGRVYLLAGRARDAVPILARGAGACEAFTRPMANTRASYFLGRAREETGDRAGACTAYAIVLRRWRDAKPRSTSADDARARSAKLGCAKE